MTEFVVGQRWLNDSDLALGLGMVVEKDHRTVTVAYPLTGDTRTYAQQNAPLSRISFTPGDTVSNIEGEQFVVVALREQDGLITYQCQSEDGTETSLAELALDPNLQLNRPAERLFNGQLDDDKWFRLRVSTWREIEASVASPVRGLAGTRTTLIPHQLYVADRIARRYAPRVLLADEVGLGKTIEAGMVLHQQILNGLVERVLVIVPETLLHQWLVEMRRRFQLDFRLINADSFRDIQESGESGNPFLASQLLLCSLDHLCGDPQVASCALEGQWDMLVVDEAHHLQWSPGQSSLEYDLIEALASESPGAMLLTGTPQQLGKQSHFARLRLLDPERYSDFEQFLEEESRYQDIVPAVQALLSDVTPGDEEIATMRQHLAGQELDADLEALVSDPDDMQARETVLNYLLDLHGTGRVLFRNTRAAVGGFPRREVYLYPLPTPAEYSMEALAASAPELLHQQQNDENNWHGFDPRVDWLIDFLRENRDRKILLITADVHTVLDIYEVLRVRTGMHAAMFHEQMSILERDRAAVFFADPEDGAQVLLCSEIGSEGRNFQFAQDLVLFDLPENPDLLEQRIGRIDRIGQQQTIRLHLPHLNAGAQPVLVRWYHEVLNALAAPCPAAFTVYQQYRGQLQQSMRDGKLESWFGAAQQAVADANQQLEQGRDVLLEANSCRPAEAQRLKQQIEQAELESDLPAWLEGAFDAFRVASEPHSEAAMVLRPSEGMREPFPYLQDEGITITWSREKALVHQDMQFVTWEHDMVQQTLERVVTNERGNATLGLIKHADYPLGQFLLECLFVANVPQRLRKYLGRITVRLLIDSGGKEVSKQFTHREINRCLEKPPRELAKKILRAKVPHLKKMCDRAIRLVEPATSVIAERAADKARSELGQEITRLKALQKRNPNVRDEEIEYFESELQFAEDYFGKLHLNIDALRVLVAT